MFGLILPSRPCLTLDALTPTTYTLAIPPAPPFTHLVVFLLPGQILPRDTAAAVYIRFPPRAAEFRFLGAIGNEKPSAIFRVRGYDAGRGGGGGGGGDGFEGGGMGGAKDGGAEEDEMVDEGDAPAPTTAAAAAAAANGTGVEAAAASAGEIQLGVAIEPLPQIRASLAALASQPQPQTQSQAAPATAQPSTAVGKLPPPESALGPVSTKILARRIIRNAFNFLASFAGTTQGGAGAEVVPLKAFQEWWVKFERRVEVDPGFLEREGEDG